MTTGAGKVLNFLGPTPDNRAIYGAVIVTTFEVLLPPGKVAIAVDHALNAYDAYNAAVAYEGGDTLPIGRFFVVQVLDEVYPQVPWDFVIPS